MYGLETIKAMNAEAGTKARAKKTSLKTFDSTQDIDDMFDGKSSKFPLLGDHKPSGWVEAMSPLFCDSSGFGSPGEPALTQDQLKVRLKELFWVNPEYGYGVVSVGQFQVHLGVFLRHNSRGKETPPNEGDSRD